MLSTGQVNDAFQSAVGRSPTGSELSQYTSDNSLDGATGQQSLISNLKGGGGLQSPGNAGQVQGFLNDYHNLVQDAAKQYEQPQLSDQQIMDEVKGAITPSTPLPQAPNMVSSFMSLRSDPNITNLETKLSQLKDQENSIKTQTMATQASEDGKPVAMNVISGRQTEEQRQADIELTSLAWQKQAVTDELTMRYTMIDNIMKFTQADYDNSVKTYQTEFQTNQAVFDAFNKVDEQQKTDHIQALSTLISATGTEVEQAQKQAEFQYQQQQDTIKNASSNLVIMANMIKGGNLNMSNLSSDQKLSIQKMEIQAGLGTGFLEHLVSDNPGGKVVYAGKNGVILQMPDGTLTTQNISVDGGGGGGGTLKPAQLKAEQSSASAAMANYLKQNANPQGHVSPVVWQDAMQKWQTTADPNGNALGLTAIDMVKNFAHFTDPNRGDFDQSYGFSKGLRSNKPQNPKQSNTLQLGN